MKINDYPAILSLPLYVLAQLSKFENEVETSIPASATPEIIGVEPASRDTTLPPAFNYTMELRGSHRARLVIKVKEAVPSISNEELERLGGSVKASVTNFRSGFIADRRGSGFIFYASAESVKPISNPLNTKPEVK